MCVYWPIEFIFWLSAFVIIYIYWGYPLLLTILPLFLKTSPIKRKEIFPYVTLIISAYNEEKVIRKKLENSINLDYPKDKLEIIVVSDCSTDATDEIVKEFQKDGVALIRQSERKGKTAGLNLAVPKAKGEIVIFSDANCLYKKDAIKKLVRNFYDKNIGCVTGDARYINKNSIAGKTEDVYWSYERFLKKKESLINSMVGGDGAIYAIRKELYTPLKETDINDFVNPLQIVLKGYRNIYEPQAICYESPTTKFELEFARKVRIVNRSLNGLLRIKEVLNPFKTGFFAIEVISHKLLRWLIPFFLILTFFSNLYLTFNSYQIYKLTFILQSLVYLLALVGYSFKRPSSFNFKFLYIPYYFVLVNLASLIGVIKTLKREVIVTWEPIRETSIDDILRKRKKGSKIIYFIAVSIFLYNLYLLNQLFSIKNFLVLSAFWWAFFIIFYTYFGYPLLLSIFTFLNKKKINKEEAYFPSVTLLIPAYNEEEIIEEKIKNSLALDYPKDKLKIMVSSDGSDDKTNKIVAQYIDKGIVLNKFYPRQGKMSVINKSIPLIDTEIIVFSDANAMYQPDAIKKLVRNLYDKTIGAVSGNVILLNEDTTFGKAESMYYKYERFLQEKETEFESIVGVDGAMYAIRKSLYPSLPDNIILDDFVISIEIINQGFRVIYDDEAIAYENSSVKIADEFRRKTRVTAGAFQTLKNKIGIPNKNNPKFLFSYISHKLLRWLVPILLIILFLANAILINYSLFYKISFLIQSVFYLLAIIGWITQKRTKILSVPFYFCMINTAALIGMYKGLMDKQEVTWEKFKRTN